jgi:hypothetical protein
LLRDAKRRGMRAPVLAVGDGALGFWRALREVFPETRQARCWFHKIANVLAALPKSAHPAAKNALAEIWNAEDKTHALAAVKAFEELFGAKFPKAVAKITDDLEELLAFYDYPAEPLGAPAHHKPDRIDLLRGQASDEDHPPAGVEGRRAGHGLQADHGGARPLAGRQRPSPRRACPGRRDVRQGQTRRTRRRSPSSHAARRDRGLTKIDPQVLTG